MMVEVVRDLGGLVLDVGKLELWSNLMVVLLLRVSRQGGRGVVVDRKAILMVRELHRFGISVVGISETKWFGSAVYDVDGN